MLEIVKNKLEEAVKDLYQVTNLKVTFYDSDRQAVFSYPEDNHNFCNIVRDCPALKKECVRCDNIAMDMCQETTEPYVYTCHMHLLEAAAPIIANREIIGYIIVGQKMEKASEKRVKEQILKISQKYKMDRDALISMMDDLQTTDMLTMESVIHVVQMCTSFLYRHRFITKRGDTVPSYQIEEYLYEHLGDDLSIPTICNHFHISKSKLYNISKQAFGIGFSDYVRKIRLYEGKRALETTQKSITRIAEDVGFTDVNYFIRMFRQKEGMSPNQYRKAYKKNLI